MQHNTAACSISHEPTSVHFLLQTVKKKHNYILDATVPLVRCN